MADETRHDCADVKTIDAAADSACSGRCGAVGSGGVGAEFAALLRHERRAGKEQRVEPFAHRIVVMSAYVGIGDGRDMFGEAMLKSSALFRCFEGHGRLFGFPEEIDERLGHIGERFESCFPA